MGRFTKRAFRLGTYYLGKRSGSVAYYRCWVEDGKLKRVTLDTDDFDVACERLREWYILNHAPKNEQPSEVYISDVLDRYVDARKAVRSISTIKGHTQHWKDRFGAATVKDACSYPKQEAFKGHLLGKGLAPNTINHVIGTGRAAIRLAWKRGEITSCPPLSTVPVTEQEPMGRPLSVEEASRLLHGAPEHISMLLMLLMGTAARPGALMELQWPQIDLEAGLIQLNPAGRQQNKKYRPVLKLPLTLIAYLKERRWPDRPVIHWKGAEVKSIKTSWRKHRTRCKLDQTVTLYSLRHTLGRWMRSKGVPVDQIQVQLGHRRLGVTERYAEYDPAYLAQATAAIDGFMCLVTGVERGKSTSEPATSGHTMMPPDVL